ncbi:MAG: hypothetical protein WB815_07090 [Nitrososphaeraceae archaeon]
MNPQIVFLFGIIFQIYIGGMSFLILHHHCDFREIGTETQVIIMQAFSSEVASDITSDTDGPT